MSDESTRRERDLILAPNEYAFISDATKGDINVFVGPYKTSLADTDRCVKFDEREKRFRQTDLTSGTSLFKTAPSGFYLVLKNPAEGDKQPSTNGKISTPTLRIGKKINLAGPVSFPLWPGQMARVLQGHHIRSNQYVLARVYDETAARENWKSAVITPNAENAENPIVADAESLTMGKLLVIRGTDVSFYIPPTGIEVVPDENGNLVRDALTLERLEYCLLRDENGSKRYERGPAVIFPEPTEIFHTSEKKDAEGKPTGERTRKFRAIELTPTSGIYVKVVAEYEENGHAYKVGDELFITGNETAIYVPREEHSLNRYNGHEIHYATAIPEGEGRYVLNRKTGTVTLVKGPVMYLPDPRNEVITRKILDAKTCELLYPGNQEALEYNQRLAQEMGLPTRRTLSAAETATASAGSARGELSRKMLAFNSLEVSNSPVGRGLGERAADNFAGDVFERKNAYTEPRTVLLNTKYSGAVATTIRTGYAVLLVDKSGNRRVVVGPTTALLEYDETPQALELSTGKPKTTDHLFTTAFLQTKANKISDIIEVETKDFCTAEIKLSYRVHFEGQKEKWFEVDNYVKFLCDHMRSRVRSAVRKFGIEEFYLNSEPLLRDIILGTAPAPGTDRPGTTFAENGMRIYDVETLAVKIKNAAIETLLVESQREAINHTLALQTAARQLEFTKRNEEIKRERAQVENETKRTSLVLAEEQLKHSHAFALATLAAQQETEEEEAEVRRQAQEHANELADLVLMQKKKTADQQIALDQQALQLRLMEASAEVQAVVEKAKAISPEFVAALNSFGERAMVAKVAEAMGPISLIGGAKRPVVEIIADLLKGTEFAKQLAAKPAANGTHTPTGATA